MNIKGKQSLKRTYENIKYILGYFYKYGKSAFVYRCLLMIANTVQVFITVNVANWIVSYITTDQYVKAIVCVGAAAVYSIAVGCVSNYYSMCMDEMIQVDVKQGLYIDLLNSIKRTKQKLFIHNAFYDQYVRALSDIDVQPDRVINTFFRFIEAFLKLLTVGAVITGISPVYVLCYLLSAVGTVIFSGRMNQCDYGEYMENTSNQRKMDYSKRLAYNPTFSENLKLENNFMNLVLDHYKTCVGGYKKVLKKYKKKKALFSSVMLMGNILFTFLFPWLYLAFQCFNKELKLGAIMVIVSSMTVMPSILNAFIIEFNALKLNSFHIENIKAIIENGAESESEEGKDTPNLITQVRFRDVHFEYDSNCPVLREINVEANKGEIIAIVGLNGAGKTTLMKLLQRLYDVNRGKIEVNGVDIKDLNVEEYRYHLASIQQDFEVYGFSIAENVLMKKPSCQQDYEIVKEALQKVGLLDKVMALPNKADTFITKEFDDAGTYFSGGEIQRLALARLYASNADIIVLDEPTSALDAINEEDVLRRMAELFSDRIVFVISHQLSLVKNADHIIVIDQHSVIENGTHDELMANGELYSKLFMAQANKYQADIA